MLHGVHDLRAGSDERHLPGRDHGVREPGHRDREGRDELQRAAELGASRLRPSTHAASRPAQVSRSARPRRRARCRSRPRRQRRTPPRSRCRRSAPSLRRTTRQRCVPGVGGQQPDADLLAFGGDDVLAAVEVAVAALGAWRDDAAGLADVAGLPRCEVAVDAPVLIYGDRARRGERPRRPWISCSRPSPGVKPGSWNHAAGGATGPAPEAVMTSRPASQASHSS